MKNKILALLIAALTITASAATLSACDLTGGDNGGTVNPPAGDVGGDTDKDNTGDADKDPDDDHSHTYDRQVAEAKFLKSAADCTHKAVYYFSCACGKAGEETFEHGNSNGHKEVTDKAVEPTCTTAGKTAGKHCSVCKEVLVAQEVIKAKGHTEVEDKAVEATCYKTGLTVGKHCSVCKKVTVEQTETPKLKHEFSGETCKHCGYHTPTEGLHYTINDDRETCSVAGIGEAVGTVIYIADEFEGKSVTGIADGAFAHKKNLTEVHIPKSVTSIGGQAFYGCSGLTEITIPERVTNIGWQPFMDCSGLESITVEKGNENYKSENNCILSIDGRTLVLGCKNSVIPEGVTIIGLGAFAGCTGLTSIILPDSVTYIDGNAFNECVNLESIVIPEDVTYIGGSSFCNCRSLTSIVIPGKVTSIGDMTFMGCEKLTIKCEAEEKPADWRDSWNYSDCDVIWGYKGEVEPEGVTCHEDFVNLVSEQITAEQWNSVFNDTCLKNCKIIRKNLIPYGEYTYDEEITVSEGLIQKRTNLIADGVVVYYADTYYDLTGETFVRYSNDPELGWIAEPYGKDVRVLDIVAELINVYSYVLSINMFTLSDEDGGYVYDFPPTDAGDAQRVVYKFADGKIAGGEMYHKNIYSEGAAYTLEDGYYWTYGEFNVTIPDEVKAA